VAGFRPGIAYVNLSLAGGSADAVKSQCRSRQRHPGIRRWNQSAGSTVLSLGGRRMVRAAGLIVLAVLMASCSPDSDVTGTTNKCATNLFASYNPKDFKQCVAACVKCENGVTTTCATSCTLKGAH
jgi:hypothetical protein